MCPNDPSCGCIPGEVGHPVVVWPGWGVNDARNNGADIQPLPVQPLRFGNFAAYQTQLKNGLEYSNFGVKDRGAIAAYNQKTYSSATMNTKGIRQVEPTWHPAAGIQPSQVQLQNMIQNGAPTPSGTGGTGVLASGVDISQRGFYG